VIASKLFDAKVCATLQRVIDTEISPELVPGETAQSTQTVVGPYELQDFNLYWITRFGFKPSKVLFLAWSAWREKYAYEEIRAWLGVFLTRFFGQSQFKRSAMPNGPKIVSGGALSPRGDWRAPSDASAKAWLEELQSTPAHLE
jgi:NAD+ synthase (glutamine-hydrolysing)